MARVGVDYALLPRVGSIDLSFVEALVACNGGVACAVATRGFFNGSSIVDVRVEDGGVVAVFSRDVLSLNPWSRFALALAGWGLRGVDVEAFDAGWAAAAVEAARLVAALLVAPELLVVAAGVLAEASRVRGRLVLDASTRITRIGERVDVDALVEASKGYTMHLKIRGASSTCIDSVSVDVGGARLVATRANKDELIVSIVAERPLDTSEAIRLLKPLAEKARCK